jgi:hypothetical protein
LLDAWDVGLVRERIELMRTHALRPVTADRSRLPRSVVIVASPTQRARRSNDPFADINTKTARGRRLADLTRAYLQALSNPPEIERQAEVIATAELQVLAEEARALALKAVGHADLDQVIRLQGAADRAVRKLGLDRRLREPVLAESFSDVAARAQAEASQRRARELAEDELKVTAEAVHAVDAVEVTDMAVDETRVGEALAQDGDFSDEALS